MTSSTQAKIAQAVEDAANAGALAVCQCGGGMTDLHIEDCPGLAVQIAILGMENVQSRDD